MTGRPWLGALCLWWSCVSLLTAANCGGSAKTGALSVRVRDLSMAAVEDAVVTVDPTGDQETSDARGVVRFPGVPSGFYTVTAEQPAVGVARSPVTVHPGATTQVTLVLRKVALADAAPGEDDGGDGSADALRGDDGGPPDAGPSDAAAIVDLNLAPLSKDTNGVDLHWSVGAGKTFTSFRVYRSRDPSVTFEVIDILNAPPTLTDRDERVQLGATYRYRIGGVGAGGAESFSNVQTITAGLFIDVASQVEKMKVDPTRPYLYAIDRVNNSLHFVNLTSNTVENTIFIGSQPTDLDINVTGDELFVANFGATEIGVVDLDARVKSRSLFVDTSQGIWDGNPYRLVCTAGDTLVFTSQDQWNDLKMVSAVTGVHIATVGSLYTPSLARNAAGTRVYATDSTSGALRYDLSATGLTQVDVSTGGGGPLNATPDGMYLFAGTRKLLANNLKSVVGTFSESILVANSTGAVAVGATMIHDGTSFMAIRALPSSTTVMALGPDDHTLYLYDTLSSRIYLYKL